MAEEKAEEKAEQVEGAEATEIKEAKVSETEVAETSKPEETKKAEPLRGRSRGRSKAGFSRAGPSKGVDIATWKPKTEIGKQVKEGAVTDIDFILESGQKVLESEIVDVLLPDTEADLLLIGQSKGKFGGGARRVFRQTQKKTKEGNKPSFATYAVAGDRNGHIGIGYGKSKETVPAREKAFRNARLNLIKIRRGSGSWESNVPEPHSIPFAVSGKCGSVKVHFMPAPKGTGLVCQSELQKMLRVAGIQDIWSKTGGKSSTRINLIKAAFNALKKLKTTKVQPKHVDALKIHE